MTTWTLGVDTSTDICVGLASDGVVVASERIDDRRGHAEKLMPLVQQTCQAAGITVSQVTEVAVGMGPGPFTGLRVGIVTGHTIASLAHSPLHGVCSLDVVARQWLQQPDRPQGEFLIASDARRKELYWARYGADGRRIGEPEVSSPDDVPRLPTVGPGADLYADRVDAVPGPRTLDAGLLAAHGLDLPSAGTEPLYLRRPDAAEPARRKSVLRLPPGQAVRR